MPLAGTLSTMSLPDLLQWLSTARKTGTLQVERDKVAKWIRLRDGRIVGCSSDDPPQRLGQFLLYQEKITEEQLSEALTAQEKTHEFLGEILVGRGLITPADLTSHLESNAEETLYSLFDWADGVFRFDVTVGEADEPFPLLLQVEDVLLRGLRRYDDMKRIREVFHDTNLVLRYTSKPPGPEIFGDAASRTMYLTIDGERTIADIVLQLHGCEYTVQKFLFDLHRDGYVEVSHSRAPQRQPAAESAPPVDRPRNDAPAPDPTAGTRPASPGPRAEDGPATAVVAPLATEEATKTDLVGAAVESSPVPDLEPLEELSLDGLEPEIEMPVPDLAPRTSNELAAQLAEAGRMMEEGKTEEALDALDRLYRSHPTNDSLRKLTAEAEAAFLDRTYRDDVPAHKIPVLKRPVDSLGSESLSPEEFFLLSRIDGLWDVKSIIQVAPLREVQALRTLKRMRDLGMIEFQDPA